MKKSLRKIAIGLFVLLVIVYGIHLIINYFYAQRKIISEELDQSVSKDISCSNYEFESDFQKEIVEKAKQRTKVDVIYDPGYIGIDYPNGDVDNNKGVCTDVIIRALRGGGLDLQKKVHEDMSANFDIYPSRRIYGLDQPDANIDHRRVPNLMTYFERMGYEIDITDNPEDYLPGDIVVWSWGGGTKHIGIVIDEKESSCERFLVVHNGGWSTVAEDRLFAWDIIGHYRVKVGRI